MKLGLFDGPSGRILGAVIGNDVIDLAPHLPRSTPAEALGAVLALGDEDRIELAAAASAVVRARNPQPTVVALDSLTPAPPFAGNKILCQVVNYGAHSDEISIAAPRNPFLFYKPLSSLSGATDEVIAHAASAQLDYECELAVVIGEPGRNIPVEHAFDHVAGYTVMNDWSYRDLQFNARAPHLNGSFGRNWTKGKGLDSACALGPWIVTADEIADPYALALSTTVNGTVRQKAVTGDMLLTIPELIAEASLGMTLHTGDVIATGTPGGVCLGGDAFLAVGDQIVCEIDGIGRLSQRVVGDDGSYVRGITL
ncbi:fumarylacetoacetate hydrolase family protein [Rhodococcus koreensis]|uniref:fumarylacetoacetate hydrolase family protein n=1 Tax=Rhodococcus koreensis TaxID=99653 RepID=UPI00366A5905